MDVTDGSRDGSRYHTGHHLLHEHLGTLDLGYGVGAELRVDSGGSRGGLAHIERPHRDDCAHRGQTSTPQL